MIKTDFIKAEHGWFRLFLNYIVNRQLSIIN